MPHDMSQTITARISQQAERASKEKRKVRQPIDNEDFRPASEDIFDQNANEAEEPDYRSDHPLMSIVSVAVSWEYDYRKIIHNSIRCSFQKPFF